MTSKGAFAIIPDDSKVLLVKRSDYPFWDLPGGRVEKGESCQAGAKREALEETGLEIEIDYLVATYHLLFKRDMQFIYAASIVGGEMITKGPETRKIRYFHKDKLPINLIPLRKKQINDYYSGKNTFIVSVKKVPWLFKLARLIKR